MWRSSLDVWKPKRIKKNSLKYIHTSMNYTKFGSKISCMSVLQGISPQKVKVAYPIKTNLSSNEIAYLHTYHSISNLIRVWFLVVWVDASYLKLKTVYIERNWATDMFYSQVILARKGAEAFFLDTPCSSAIEELIRLNIVFRPTWKDLVSGSLWQKVNEEPNILYRYFG